MNWTERQREVIDQSGSDLLVAAAAGSGKTAVLVERIKRLVIEEGVPIDRFLVVTFTRAAAAEMKEKIVDAITKAAEEDPAKSSMLRRQLDKIPSSSISTFDSFAIDIVREYFYVIDIEPNLSIIDPDEGTLLQIEAMDEVFDEIYEEGDPEILNYITAFSRYDSDTDLKNKLINIYDRLMSMPEGLGWLRTVMDSQDEIENRIKEYVAQVTKVEAERAEEALSQALEYLDEEEQEKTYEKVSADLVFAKSIKDADVSDVYGLISSHTFEAMNNTGELKKLGDEKEVFKGYRDEGKNIINDLANRYYKDSMENELAVLRLTLPYMEAMLKILSAFEENYSRKKIKRGVMDFSDSNHYAINILKDENVCSEIREKYDYIFVDEYQDSNYLQEEIIAAIKRPDNLFMVGDIKQSIYGFRMAEPDIFKARYKAYKEEGSDGEKIDLNSNFRSKKSVIDTVNDIFKDLMEDYDEDAMLYLGDTYDGEINHKSELHIMYPSEIKEIDDEELAKLKDTEIEARLVANLVRENLGKEIYDSKQQTVRKVEKRDIVILIRNAKNRAEYYYEALMSAGIDAYIDDNSGYFNTIEISSFLDLLRVIDNRRQDIPLLSVLRMPCFDFSIDELIKIRLYDKKSYYHEAFINYGAEEEVPDMALQKKVRGVLDFLDYYGEKQAYTPVDELAWDLLLETGYYNYAGALPAGERRQANLRNFVSSASKYASGSFSSLHGLIRYIENAKDNIDTGQAMDSSEGDDTVRIMTIHKSKGLEFPVVIVAGLGEDTKKNDKISDYTWRRDMGFAMKYVNLEEKYNRKTILQRVISDMEQSKRMEEEIRVLYVALTRAKEKLIMVGLDKNKDSSYLKMIEPVIDKDITDIIVHSLEELSDSSYDIDETLNRYERIAALEGYTPAAGDDELAGRLSFEYPYLKDLERKTKYSVTELNAGEDRRYDLKVPDFAADPSKISGAPLGTIMHTVMEHLDFGECSKLIMNESAGAEMFDGKTSGVAQEGKMLDGIETLGSDTSGAGRDGLTQYIRRTVEKLVEANYLTAEEGAAVRINQIADFFASDIGRRAAAADTVEKERHFTILHDMDGEEIIVQGVIDCFFEENGKMVLVDYKTNYNTRGIEDLYREQMQLYKEALEKSTGKEVAEAHLYLFKEGRSIEVS